MPARKLRKSNKRLKARQQSYDQSKVDGRKRPGSNKK